MTIDTKLPSSDPMRFRKNFLNHFIKRTKVDQLNILDNRIRANKAQYDLDRKNTELSALSSGELEKYEYLAETDLGYKPDVIQKAKCGYSPLGKVFIKGLDESDKKEGLLKRLKKIEGKSDYKQLKIKKKKQVETIKDEDEGEDMEAFYSRLRGKIPRQKKSILIPLLRITK